MLQLKLILALALAVLSWSTATAQNSCPQCGQIHSVAPGSSGVFNVVDLLNRQRAARGGLYALIPDPTLQAVAERRAIATAAPGRFRGHPPGSFAPGRFEGVGYSSRSMPSAVSACGTYTTRFRYVGAAMVRRSNGCYFAVVYR